MSPAEAKTKWCPFVRVAGGVACIADGCMAWRWIQDAAFKSKAETKFRQTGVRLQPERGFCGLVGSPE